MINAGNVRLPYVPKSRLVYEHIRDRIVRGELAAGTRVPLDVHARSLGVSHMPVRDALRQLEHDGLVVSHPHVGAVVSQVSLQDLQDTFSLREVLEGLSARLAARRMTDAERKEVLALCAALASLARRRPLDEEEFQRVNREFHTAVDRASRSAHLEATLAAVRDRGERYLRLLRFVPGRATVAQREHEATARALVAGNAQAAERAARAHIRRVVKDLSPHVHRMSEIGRGASRTGRSRRDARSG